jgi:hypothetical protein
MFRTFYHSIPHLKNIQVKQQKTIILHFDLYKSEICPVHIFRLKTAIFWDVCMYSPFRQPLGLHLGS